jgi:glycerophosphoryl diester phosphodiesterase
MKAFRLALEAGYGIELDIHLMKDGDLAVIHDPSLKRTAGVDVEIEDLTTEDLKKYQLEGTEETIPQFKEVLELFAGKAPLIVELKAERGNHAALAAAATAMLDSYDGVYCIESFDPRCILWLKKNRPEIIRGQLSQNFVKKNENLSLVLRIALTHLLTNFLTVPDFIAYNFEHRKDTAANTICRKLWKGQGVSWTLRTKEDYDQAVKEGLLPIFEYFRP